MTFLGMDIDQVSEQVRSIRTGEQRVQSLSEDVETAVSRSAEHWRGPDADLFRSSWETIRVDLRSAAHELLARSTELRRHQDEQTAASESDGSSAGSSGHGPTAADGPSAADGPVEKTNAPGEEPYRGTADPEVAERWRKMPKEDREKVAQTILDEQLARYGIDPVTIDFSLLDANGWWRFTTENGHTVEINGSILSNPDLLHTLAHEARHAGQWEAVQDTEPGPLDWLPFVDSTEDDYERLEDEHGFTREEIDSWREHWDTPEDEQDPYYDRSVEVDARNAGAEFTDGITTEDLDRYEEAAGVS